MSSARQSCPLPFRQRLWPGWLRPKALACLGWLLVFLPGAAPALEKDIPAGPEAVPALETGDSRSIDANQSPGQGEEGDAPRTIARERLARRIAHHFRVGEDHAREVVEAAFAAGERYRLPATVVLGLIAVESDFRHSPPRRNGLHGLMQIHGRIHAPVAGGSGQLAVIAEHLDLGTRLLRRYLDLYRTLPRALQRYKGRLDGAPHYAQRILDWQARFEMVLADPDARLVAPGLRVRKIPEKPAPQASAR